jgi:membrane protein implicated in regulation of membrane protease activity
MAVEPRHDVHRLRLRLRGYLLAVPILAGWAVIGHWWMSEPWSATIEIVLFALAASVLYGETRAWRLRRIHRRPDRAEINGPQQ